MLDFMDDIPEKESIRLKALFKRFSNAGQIINKEQFNYLGDKLFEFKVNQRRIICAYDIYRRHVLIVTHGFTKKQQKTPKKEIDRALELLDRYYNSNRLN
ncbi:MAG: type II toxin-antitoxin system RelE/ParE family toxin [Nitrospirae bacterium]|nr:type II toxin-antitoxin system RelE/ParE family toxin [Nitrospirota bacterium]